MENPKSVNILGCNQTIDFHTNAEGRLHRVGAPAMRSADGFEVYAEQEELNALPGSILSDLSLLGPKEQP